MEDLVVLAHTMAVTYQVTENHISKMSLDEMTIFLKRPDVIESTREFVGRLLSYYIESSRLPMPTTHINARVFLAIFLLAVHTDSVLEIHTDETGELVKSANNLITQFSRITKVLMLPLATATKEKYLLKLAKDFHRMTLVEYIPKFTAWKAVDEVRLVRRIHHAIWSLLRAAVLITPATTESIDMQDPIIMQLFAQVNRLRLKLRQIGGAQKLSELDDLIEKEMQERRFFVLICQQHVRNGGEGCPFDFIQQ